MKFLYLLSAVFALNFIIFCDGVSLDEDLTLTLAQKRVLDKFKERVKSRLPHEYMNSEIYLVRWLRAKNFHLRAAEQMLVENLRWRKRNKLDTILKEDWKQVERDYPYSIEGCDKTGRPVIGVTVGDWDVRKGVRAGQSSRMMRYLDKFMEETNVVVRAAQSQGRNVTQYTQIFDMSDYNKVDQGCPRCVPIYTHLFTSYETHFPGGVHRMYLINTPESFGPLLSVLKPLMAKSTQEALFVYGRDKRQWKRALLDEIAEEKLPPSMGGTKEPGTGYNIQEFRESGKLPC